MKQKHTKSKKWFSKKPLVILFGMFVGVGIAALTITTGVIVPPECQVGGAGGKDRCGYAYTKGSIDSFGDSIDSFVLETQNGEFFKVTNHTGELVEVPEIGGYSHSHSGGNFGHSHPGPVYTWSSIFGLNHSHLATGTTTEPTSGQHQTAITNGFINDGVNYTSTLSPASGSSVGQTYPGRGYHQMNAGTYDGKWIGIDMQINGTNDYHIYETKPKKLFIPNKNTAEFAKFANATRKSGDATFAEADVALTGATAPADGTIAYDDTAPELGGVEVCRVADAVSTECIFTCGDTFTDSRNGNSYGTVEIGGKCWFTDDLDYSELTAAQAAEFEAAAGGNYTIYDGTTSFGPFNPGYSAQAFPELWGLCEDLGGAAIQPYTGGEQDLVYVVGTDVTSGGTNTPSYYLECYDEGTGDIFSKNYIYSTEESGYSTTPGVFYLSDMVRSVSTVGADDGTCPAGWHVPTDDEWREMETTLGMDALNVTRWDNSNLVGDPVTGLTQGNAASPTYYNRDITTASQPLITTMGWNTGNHDYWMRDRTEKHILTTGQRPTGHIIRRIAQYGSNTRFTRQAQSADLYGSITRSILPTPLRIIAKFIPTVDAIATGPAKSKIRCVEGDAVKNWVTTSWSSCTAYCPQAGCSVSGSSCVGGPWCSGGPSGQRTRTRTCKIGDTSVAADNYSVYEDHCINSPLTTPAITQSCILPLGPGPSGPFRR